MIKDKPSIVMLLLSGSVSLFSVFTLFFAMFRRELVGTNDGLIFYLIVQIIILLLIVVTFIAIIFPVPSTTRRMILIYKSLLLISCLQLAYFLVFFLLGHSPGYELAVFFTFLAAYSFARVRQLRHKLT
jgi:membrane-associated HD superfamily phosphohydrolase